MAWPRSSQGPILVYSISWATCNGTALRSRRPISVNPEWRFMRYRISCHFLFPLGCLAFGTILLHGQSTNVNKTQFGKVCSSAPGAIDGQITGQPLVATGTIKGHNHVVYLATLKDSVYAFDGDSPTCAPILHVSLLPSGEKPVSCADVSGKCNFVAPIIGILSTPVIDIESNTIYVVTYSESTNVTCPAHSPGSACFNYRLHALDLTTLQEQFKGPVTIAGSAGGIVFDPQVHFQRPGLLLVARALPNGHAGVYVASSMIDGSPNRPNGWVFVYDSKDLTAKPYIFSTTNGVQAGGGGVWGSGAGIAYGADSPGGDEYLYFTTGDGVFNANRGGKAYGDSFLKLTPTLSVAGFFTPYDQDCLRSKDLDLGSSGVMLI